MDPNVRVRQLLNKTVAPKLTELKCVYRRCFLFGLALSLAYLNYRGLTVVGHTIITAVIVILVPFVILVVLCAPDVRPLNWLKIDLPNVDWVSNEELTL